MPPSRLPRSILLAATLATTLALPAVQAAQAAPHPSAPSSQRTRAPQPDTAAAPTDNPFDHVQRLARAPSPTPLPCAAPRCPRREGRHPGPADQTAHRAAPGETRRRALHPRRHHRPEPRAVRGLPRRPGRHRRRLSAQPPVDLGPPADPRHVRRARPGRGTPHHRSGRRPRRQERQPPVRDVHVPARGGLPGLLARRDRHHRRPHRRRRTARGRRLRHRGPHLRRHPHQRRHPARGPLRRQRPGPAAASTRPDPAGPGHHGPGAHRHPQGPGLGQRRPRRALRELPGRLPRQQGHRLPVRGRHRPRLPRRLQGLRHVHPPQGHAQRLGRPRCARGVRPLR